MFVVKRLDCNAIRIEIELVAGMRVDDRQGEHTLQHFDKTRTEPVEQRQYHTAVGVTIPTRNAVCFRQFTMVIDLTDEDAVPTVQHIRLAAIEESIDGQSRMAEQATAQEP